MKIKLEQSGGFAGLSSSNELDLNRLPRSLQKTVKELLEKKILLPSKILRRPQGSADYLTYKISIQDGNKGCVIECNEFDMDRDIKSLVGFFQKNSKKI